MVGQTAPLYYQYTVTVSRTPAATAADLQVHQVGALSGSAYVDALRAALGASNVHEYPSTADLLADVRDGRIGAAVAASGEAQYQLKQAGYKGLTITRLSLPGVHLIYGVDMPYTKTNVQLGTALSQDIAALRTDGQILTRWGMDDPVTLNGGSPGQ